MPRSGSFSRDLVHLARQFRQVEDAACTLGVCLVDGTIDLAPDEDISRIIIKGCEKERFNTIEVEVDLGDGREKLQYIKAKGFASGERRSWAACSNCRAKGRLIRIFRSL